MNEPKTEQELAASLAQTTEVAQRLEELLKGLPPLVQLDALLGTYVKLGIAHDQLEKVGTGLLELGGSIVFRQMLMQQRPARTTVPASGEADHHPAPPTVQ